MLRNVLRNLVGRPATRINRGEQISRFAGSRGRIVFCEDRCCYCGACARGCPVGAISITGARESGEVTLGYNPFACIYCGRCAEICPCCAVDIMAKHAEPAGHKEILFRKEMPV